MQRLPMVIMQNSRPQVIHILESPDVILLLLLNLEFLQILIMELHINKGNRNQIELGK